jgi:hypothetical protein
MAQSWNAGRHNINRSATYLVHVTRCNNACLANTTERIGFQLQCRLNSALNIT